MRIFYFIVGLFAAFVENCVYQLIIFLIMWLLGKIGISIVGFDRIGTICLACIIQIIMYVRKTSDEIYFKEENITKE